VAAILISACGGASRPEPENPMPADPEVATQLVVEQFLRAANSNDLDTMARLFGTVDGSILEFENQAQVDQRMFALASILRHDGFNIRRFDVVPGRRDEAMNAIVNMRFGERAVDVPFTLVWSTERTWMIENIGIANITNRSE
jgi:hypothetical protein